MLTGSGFPSSFAAAFRQPPGLTRTLEQVARAFPSGLDPRHAVWIWRRALELVGWLHQSGVVHGQLLPAHLLVDAREHAVGFVGFSSAGRAGTMRAVTDPEAAEIYPAGKAELLPATDLVMLARCIVHALGGRALDVPAHVPAPLARLLTEQASGSGSSEPAAVSRKIVEVARDCFGPPRFIELELP